MLNSTNDLKLSSLSDPRVVGNCRCIYVDPPWRYDNSSVPQGGVHGHYHTMTVEQICNLPIWKLQHRLDGAHVWMWTTWPMTRDGITHRVLRNWGVHWVGEIVWAKIPRWGTGYWLRPCTEILVLATTDKQLKLLHKKQRGYVSAPRLKHSQKPDVFYEIIESLSPGPRLELFARRPRDGWFRWGDEA